MKSTLKSPFLESKKTFTQCKLIRVIFSSKSFSIDCSKPACRSWVRWDLSGRVEVEFVEGLNEGETSELIRK